MTPEIIGNIKVILKKMIVINFIMINNLNPTNHSQKENS